MNNLKALFATLLLTVLIATCGCATQQDAPTASDTTQASQIASEAREAEDSPVTPETAQVAPTFDLTAVPAYSASPYAVVNGNVPGFTEDDITTKSFERYAELDSLGRCGTAFACIGKDLMPTEERGSIGEVKPSGWHLSTYDKSVIADRYLFNRCHLIGYQLTAENANEKNLITGTRYMNVEGMLPFENLIADYVERTGNHVMYRVTPVFEDANLVAAGVHMEAYSVEDGGRGVSFNVFCYNVQPHIVIDYATGENHLEQDEQVAQVETQAASDAASQAYVLNVNSKKFHHPSCDSVTKMKEKNKQEVTATRDELIAQGYDPCGSCTP